MRVHFIGVCGSGMSGAAIIAAQAKNIISGSDLKKPNPELYKTFIENRIKITSSHSVKNLKNIDVVVKSIAIPIDNIEVKEAVRRGIPVLTRMQFLDTIFTMHHDSISIIGSFGKSTTASAIAEILLSLNYDITAYAGCTIPNINSTAVFGKSKQLAVVETCEYFEEILHAKPTYCLLTSVGINHEDQFDSSTAKTYELFERFFQKNSSRLKGIIVPGKSKLEFKNKHNFITYGEIGDDWHAVLTDISIRCMRFDVYHRNNFYCKIESKLLGEINMKNLTGAIALLDSYGLHKNELQSALLSITPVPRRFEIKSNTADFAYIDDNARLPDQIQETINSALLVFPDCYYVVSIGIWGKINARNLYAVCQSLSNANYVVIAPSAEYEINAGGAESTHADERLKEMLISRGILASIGSDSIVIENNSLSTCKKTVLIFCGYDNLSYFGFECHKNLLSRRT